MQNEGWSVHLIEDARDINAAASFEQVAGDLR
jgi:hypothetical protein